MSLCEVCGHPEHAGKCNQLMKLGKGWMICTCGVRGVSPEDQQAIVNTFERLRVRLMDHASAHASRAFGARVNLHVCGRVCKPTVC